MATDMRLLVHIFALALGLSVPRMALADSSFGAIQDAQSSLAGLYVLPALLPANCSNTHGGWVLIAKADQLLIAHFLTLHAQLKPMRIHTNGQQDPSGYCYVTDLGEH